MSKIKEIAPAEIEKLSFEIISHELGDHKLNPLQEPIIKRVIHTTADFEYVHTLTFSEGVVERAMAALRAGATIVTDTQMAAAGINKAALAKLGCKIHCFISDVDVAKEAEEKGVTRSSVCMDRGVQVGGKLIFAVGNAPTALIRLEQLIREGGLRPELIIAVPVGFVNVVEAKVLITQLDIPFIVARGRKGGSNVAAAICNALLYMCNPRPATVR
ncbi:MAG: precorrin-8X methylmutase [Bacillota bacterium]|nr:precorrin-8X methylmutase [Bacillota bacterium]